MHLSSLLFLVAVGFAAAETNLYPRGCIYALGKCVKECEEGTHGYSSGCIGPFTREATCENPNPQPDPNGAICDYTACYCDAPTVRDSATGRCVSVEQCTAKKEE